ncbi:MAG: peptide subunit release factor 1 (eRF1) [Haloarculaceae archaeon]|jgi:peptide subunit release factor 1 (eRF1)
MLDDLLGRTELKERIETLEEEKEHLQRQLDAEQERRAEAVTDRQEAQRQVNRLEDRIEQLEDQVERLQSEDVDVTFREESTISDNRLEEILSRLDSVRTEPEGVLTAYVGDGHDLPDVVRDAFGDRAPLIARAAPCLVVTDDAGLLGVCLSTPVAPEPFTEWSDRVQLDHAWFQPLGSHTLALIRSDLFAMGVYDGRDRTAFHGFDSDLTSQHSKGGFSQARFERLRDEEIDDHLDRCRAALEERTTDRLYVVGERSVLPEFGDVATVTEPVDATGDPEAALEDAFEEFWTVQMRTL